MPFTPNDYVLDQLLTLVELWKDRTTSEEDDLQDEDTSDESKKLPNSLPTKKFLKLIKGGLTKELLVKYWENVPALQELIEKPNFNEITLKSDKPESEESEKTGEMPPDQEPMPPDQTQIPGEEPLGQPTSEVPTDQGQLPSADLTGPAAPVEPPVPTGPTPKDIVSAMAKRRKDRVMEQARRSLRNSRSML